MIIRKNRKALLTAAAILGGTVTTSVHADEFTDVYNKVQAFNSRVDSQLSTNVKLGETVTVPVASVAEMEQQVNQHIASTDQILANKGDIAAELAAYNARKDAYNAERNAAIKWNKENGTTDMFDASGNKVLTAPGTGYQKTDISKIFTEENVKKLYDHYNNELTDETVELGLIDGKNPGVPIRLVGPDGVDVIVTWSNHDEKQLINPIYLDPYRKDLGHAFDFMSVVSRTVDTDPTNKDLMPDMAPELTFEFVKTGTNDPVNIATLFKTTDFDRERLAIRSDNGVSELVESESQFSNLLKDYHDNEGDVWDIYRGEHPYGYPNYEYHWATISRNGSVTAFAGSNFKLRLFERMEVMGLFAPIPEFSVKESEAKPVPPEFSEPAPTAKPVTIQKLALPERIVTTEPIPVTTRYIDNPDELPGYQVVRQEGKAGVLTITKTNGVSDGGKITTPMIERVIERGTCERIVTTEPIPVTTRYIDNPDELPGHQVVRQEGKAGVLTITKTNGVSDGGKITTPMIERVIERGTGVDIVEPIKVEYKAVDTIPYGEQKVIVEGRARVTRNNKERVAGITRIVEVGTAKTEYTKTGTVETRYIPDANTPYGKTREFTKGYQGLTTVETTASVDANGNIVNPVTTKTVEEKQDHIIAVGNVKKEPITIPFETKYIDDPTLKKGEEVVEVKGVNGTGYSVIGHEINPQTGELGASQTSTTITTRPVMALIRRGTKVEETPVVETPVTDNTVKETPMTVVAPLLVETHVEENQVTPVTETPVTETETPVTETETPVTETPVTETPVTEIPVTETPVTETETPITETPVTETTTTETPVTETPITETPVTETPVTETPVTETHVTETPVTEAPVTETPVTDKPVTDKPVTETPVTETPVTETPVTETPVTETHVTEKPITDKPVTETPKTETPVTETPKTGTPKTETPITETPTTEPTITKPTLQTTQATATQSTATQPTAQTAVKTTQPLPQTGDTSGLSTIVGLVSTITSGLGLTRKRRNKKD